MFRQDIASRGMVGVADGEDEEEKDGNDDEEEQKDENDEEMGELGNRLTVNSSFSYWGE